jgi:hypothetical protein
MWTEGRGDAFFQRVHDGRRAHLQHPCRSPHPLPMRLMAMLGCVISGKRPLEGGSSCNEAGGQSALGH